MAEINDVPIFPDVDVSGATLRDSRALTPQQRRAALGFLADALRFLPIELSCGVESPIIAQVAKETGQEARLAQIASLRVTAPEREGQIKPRIFGLLNGGGRVIGALELMSIAITRTTPSEVFLRARSFPAFQSMITGNPSLRSSYVLWVRAHTAAIRALMRERFPLVGGRVARTARLKCVVVLSAAGTNPLCLAFDDEIASLLQAGVVEVKEERHPRIPEIIVRSISPR